MENDQYRKFIRNTNWWSWKGCIVLFLQSKESNEHKHAGVYYGITREAMDIVITAIMFLFCLPSVGAGKLFPFD